MKLTFLVWSLLSKNRFLIGLVKKIIAPLWTYKYKRDRSIEAQKHLSNSSFANLQAPSSDIFQVVIVITDYTAEQVLRGASDFFSHLGVSTKIIRQLKDEKNLTPDFLVVDLSSNTENQFLLRREKNYCILSGPFENLVVEKFGLRSFFCQNLLTLLEKELHFPLITTLPEPLIGFRIDDVTPSEATFSFLTSAKACKIPINLGLFLNAFVEGDLNSQKFFNNFRNDNFDFSPHSFDELTPIFYDLKQNRAYSDDKIKANFATIIDFFSKWKIEISPIINAHFHTVDINALRELEALGGKYFISEIHPQHHKIVFGQPFRPQGDPVNCTGAKHCSTFQIYSGDSSRDHLNKNNSYDFLDLPNIDEKNIFVRSVKRLELSLSTGFPAFLTTHGYEIDKSIKTLDQMDFFRKIQLWRKATFSDARFANLETICSSFEARAECHIFLQMKEKENEKSIDFELKSYGRQPVNITCIGMSKIIRSRCNVNSNHRVDYGQDTIQII